MSGQMPTTERYDYHEYKILWLETRKQQTLMYFHFNILFMKRITIFVFTICLAFVYVFVLFSNIIFLFESFIAINPLIAKLSSFTSL